MNTKQISLTAAVLILSAAALHSYNVRSADTVPPNVAKNIRVQAAPGACQPLTIIDQPKLALRANGLALVNISLTSNAFAACAPLVDVSGNGTTEVGLYIGNNDGGLVATTTTCVMTYNTAGLGPKTITKQVTVQRGLIGKIAWPTADFIAFGGPVSIICNLHPRGAMLRVYTISQQSS